MKGTTMKWMKAGVGLLWTMLAAPAFAQQPFLFDWF